MAGHFQQWVEALGDEETDPKSDPNSFVLVEGLTPSGSSSATAICLDDIEPDPPKLTIICPIDGASSLEFELDKTTAEQDGWSWERLKHETVAIARQQPHSLELNASEFELTNKSGGSLSNEEPAHLPCASHFKCRSW
jgi:hypothetical protein